MTDTEQLLLELVNRARANPAAEADRYNTSLNEGLPAGTISPDPKQPLAPNQILIDVAGAHSQDMLDNDYFGHENGAGQRATQRANAAGYPHTVSENISVRGSTEAIDPVEKVLESHAGLFQSAGHRRNILEPGVREIGAGVRIGRFTNESGTFNASMVTENFSNPGGDPFITGVAYTDAVVNDDFYTVGEGLGSVQIVATNVDTGAEFTTMTGPSGGYSLQTPDGAYVIVAEGAGVSRTLVSDIVVDGQNVKVDFDGRPTGSISGRAYNDQNEDGVKNGNEPWLEGWQVYLDFNNNAALDAGEAVAVTDEGGAYAFEGLTANSYHVRLALPAGWRQSLPAGAHVVNLAAGEDVVEQDFGAHRVDVSPQARDDRAAAAYGSAVTIDVLANDLGVPDGAAVRITSPPQSGQASVDAETNRITFAPADGFSGAVSLRYAFEDREAQVSSEATAVFVVSTAERPWQNPIIAADVNNSGQVEIADLLAVVVTLRAGVRELPDAATSSDVPPFVDVSGDGEVSVTDVLEVVRELRRRLNAPAGEPPVLEQDVSVAPGQGPVRFWMDAPAEDNSIERLIEAIAIERAAIK